MFKYQLHYARPPRALHLNTSAVTPSYFHMYSDDSCTSVERFIADYFDSRLYMQNHNVVMLSLGSLSSKAYLAEAISVILHYVGKQSEINLTVTVETQTGGNSLTLNHPNSVDIHKVTSMSRKVVITVSNHDYTRSGKVHLWYDDEWSKNKLKAASSLCKIHKFAIVMKEEDYDYNSKIIEEADKLAHLLNKNSYSIQITSLPAEERISEVISLELPNPIMLKPPNLELSSKAPQFSNKLLAEKVPNKKKYKYQPKRSISEILTKRQSVPYSKAQVDSEKSPKLLSTSNCLSFADLSMPMRDSSFAKKEVDDLKLKIRAREEVCIDYAEQNERLSRELELMKNEQRNVAQNIEMRKSTQKKLDFTLEESTAEMKKLPSKTQSLNTSFEYNRTPKAAMNRFLKDEINFSPQFLEPKAPQEYHCKGFLMPKKRYKKSRAVRPSTQSSMNSSLMEHYQSMMIRDMDSLKQDMPHLERQSLVDSMLKRTERIRISCKH